MGRGERGEFCASVLHRETLWFMVTAAQDLVTGSHKGVWETFWRPVLLLSF